MPLTRVSLYKHGIGYFERRGEVIGPCRIELSCGPDEIDDMLKSLLVLKEGSKISAITYESAKPLDERLCRFGFDLRVNDGFVKLVSRLKGVPVSVECGATTTSGKVIGIDVGRKSVDNEVITEEFLVVYTDAGELRRLLVNRIDSLNILDQALSEELKQQLDLLFLSLRKKDQKLLNVEIRDTDKSEVTIAYSIANPIWKTSYRLLFDEEDKLLIQGVAIVDNVQDEDWENVEMTLVSAAPISFIQPLYHPIKPVRQTIQAQGVESSTPFVAQRAMSIGGLARAGMASSACEMDDTQMSNMHCGDSGATFGLAPPGSAGGMVAPQPQQAKSSFRLDSLFEQELDVDGEQTGELFEYKIKDPVSVPRDSSALIPVVQQFIEGERVSLYKEERNKDFPYSAVRLINTTGLTLEAGPITVMDTNSYAGECLLDVLKPDDKRILPYALDQSVSVVVRQDFEKRPIWKVQIVDGVMVLHHKQTSKKRYLLENLSSGKKIVYVEYPYQDGWKLAIGEEAEEITRNFYRFRVELSEKETCELNVTLESDAVESYSPFAINAEHHQIQWLLKQNFVDETLLAFLKKGLVVKGELDRLTNEVHRIEAEIAGEEQNQFRARENVKTLGANAGRFKESIEQSEDRIVALQQKLKKERSDAFVKEKELKDLFRQNLESELNKSTPAKV